MVNEPQPKQRRVGRPEKPFEMTDAPVAAFAAALRELRGNCGEPTYAALARRSGVSASALSEAARGKRLPSWRIARAYVEACGGDVDDFRPRWQTAADGTDTDSRTADPALPEAVERGPYEEGATGGRWIPRRRAALVSASIVFAAAISVVGLTVAATLGDGRHPPRGHATPAGPPGTYLRPTGAPAAPYPIRRFGDTSIRAGERLTLDAPPGGDWPRAISGSVGYDLEFTLADRLLVSVGTQTTGSSLAWISHPTNTYDDCKTSDYSGVVPTKAILPGTEFCVLTGQHRRALVTIRSVERDPQGLPAQVTVTITTWDHIVPPGS
jgi:transcriptional regulator with XRE-family HTH domain